TSSCLVCRLFFQAEDGIRDRNVTGVQTCALPIFIAAVAYSGVVFARRRRRQAEPAVESEASPTTSAGVSPSIPPTDGDEAVRERSEERRVGKEWRRGRATGKATESVGESKA